MNMVGIQFPECLMPPFQKKLLGMFRLIEVHYIGRQIPAVSKPSYSRLF